jgi:hypothetical protein
MTGALRSRCLECGATPARLALPDREGERLCGVCWHRCLVAYDLARRLLEARRVGPR